jgi:NitT/TauT family transport system substrate-binding protein
MFGMPRIAVAESAPETSRIRLARLPAVCVAPQYVAEELLRIEGFSEVEYVEALHTSDTVAALAEDRIDIGVKTAPFLVNKLDSAPPVVVLAGMHLGCYELFAREDISAIRDLKHKTIAISGFESSEHIFLASMVAYVGMDPRKDVDWAVTGSTKEAMNKFIEGRADAFLAFPPEPQELRARNIGRVVVNTALDRPWSNYYCCMIAASKAFVDRYPAAAHRALRALLKAADLCASDPDATAGFLVEKGYEPRIDIAKEVLNDINYAAWRQYSPEDAMRFHALRLHEVGMIHTPPNQIIANGTDWRILNELKRELKA